MSLRERIFRSFFQQVPRQVLFGTRLSNHHYRTFQNKKNRRQGFFSLVSTFFVFLYLKDRSFLSGYEPVTLIANV